MVAVAVEAQTGVTAEERRRPVQVTDVLSTWVLASLPIAVLVGRMLRGRTQA